MKTEIILFDFEDSFTLNIASELYLNFQLETKVLPHSKISQYFSKRDKSCKRIIILGPGPGHPNEYRDYFPVIEEALSEGEKFFGVCLGHQVLWSLWGAEFKPSDNPIHGRSVTVDLNSFWQQKFKTQEPSISVQRYNSLVVRQKELNYIQGPEAQFLFSQNELMASCGENFITYQFHPESIGTEKRKLLLSCALEHLGVEYKG